MTRGGGEDMRMRFEKSASFEMMVLSKSLAFAQMSESAAVRSMSS